MPRQTTTATRTTKVFTFLESFVEFVRLLDSQLTAWLFACCDSHEKAKEKKKYKILKLPKPAATAAAATASTVSCTVGQRGVCVLFGKRSSFYCCHNIVYKSKLIREWHTITDDCRLQSAASLVTWQNLCTKLALFLYNCWAFRIALTLV